MQKVIKPEQTVRHGIVRAKRDIMKNVVRANVYRVSQHVEKLPKNIPFFQPNAFDVFIAKLLDVL